MINEKLINAIKNDNLILFIGAGCSSTFNFPSWKNLVSDILDNLDENFSDSSSLNFKNLKKKLENGIKSPLEILREIENESDSGKQYVKKSKEYIFEAFNNATKDKDLSSEMHRLFWEVSSKIITTNYDYILESNDPNITSKNVFTNNNDFLVLQSQKETSEFLYKIHGDYKNPDTIVLFESDYNNIYNTENSNHDALSTFFKNKTLLFIVKDSVAEKHLAEPTARLEK